MNDQFIASLLSVAVWGSLSASILTGTYSIIQAVVDSARRKRFAALGVLCLLIAVVDYLYPYLEHLDYEKLRIVLWTSYAALILALFDYPRRTILASLVALPSIGSLLWYTVDPRAATSGVVPTAFLLVRPAGRTHLGVKVSRGPGKGNR